MPQPSPGGPYPLPPGPRKSSCGIVSCVLAAVLLFLVVPVLAALILPALAAARTSSRETQCKNHLKQLSVYFALYESKNKVYPPSWKEVYSAEYVTDPGVLMCPVTRTDKAPLSHIPWEELRTRIGYEYRRPEDPATTPMGALVAWDMAPHPNGKRCCVTFGGSVEALEEEEFLRRKSATGPAESVPRGR